MNRIHSFGNMICFESVLFCIVMQQIKFGELMKYWFQPSSSACFILLLKLNTIWCFCKTGIVSLFGGIDYMSVRALVDYRVKQLVYVCLKAVHQKRLVKTIYLGFSTRKPRKFAFLHWFLIMELLYFGLLS